MRVLVTGAGGAIGGHLVKALLQRGDDVVATDIKPPKHWWQVHKDASNWGYQDLTDLQTAVSVVANANPDHIYNLAENMGGIGFITANKVDCAQSIRIGLSMLYAAASVGVDRFFFSSSACVYNTNLQSGSKAPSLKESDAWPANPESGYGLSKLYIEELCQYYAEETDLQVRIARFHNVYGPHGSWKDGREKAPAALCRKIAFAKKNGDSSIEIWGDGSAIRSYLYVSDCVRGIIDLMDSNYDKPVNIGSTYGISVSDLAFLIEEIAGWKVQHCHVNGALGVQSRNADISLADDMLGWMPEVTLRDGLTELYRWIEAQVNAEP